MKKIVLLSLLGALIYWSGCKKKAALSPIPTIDSLSFTTDSTTGDSLNLHLVHAGLFEDTVKIAFEYTDGDADLGNDPTGSNYDIFLKDSRYTDSVYKFFFPDIPGSLRSSDYGMSGTCVVFLQAALLYPRDSLHMITGDTLSLEVYIKDQAGHESNHYTTPRLYIRP